MTLARAAALMRGMLLIGTNTEDDEALAEDRALASLLAAATGDVVDVADVREIPARLREAPPPALRILLRNCWRQDRRPDDLWGAATLTWQLAVAAGIAVSPPPPKRNGGRYHENKLYLVDLFEQGFAVLPTRLGGTGTPPPSGLRGWVSKPIDGTSSRDVAYIPPRTRRHRALKKCDTVIQPCVPITYETSFWFIDGEFQHATRAPGGRRWSQRPWQPRLREIDWARRFVRWVAQPYGIMRIDAAVVRDRLRLMEVEDTFCYLSLEDLDEATRARFVAAIARSVTTMPPASRVRS